MPVTEPRGVRNRNPGNIDYNPANRWQGQLKPDPAIEKRFARFNTPENGIRAMGKLLLAYQQKHGLKTVKAIIGRWAPDDENETAAYVHAVEVSSGTPPGAEIDLTSPSVMRGIVKAIIHHENGGYSYTDAVLAEGVRRALL
ncbi:MULTISPECIES: structural protein [unclassified Pseudomonas]|uniref:structural protein n=1 Tax=unclassified Pseudomonas TaxID=196821 RepID=UPI001F40489A|nr:MULTISPECIES: structural protein [unclassified Pseudomonas]MCF5233106.1 structural protein [Pseudomonas sp. PA-5-4H]MCF5237399.1 structural protein [Pseudomonas sp. PA-5-4G]MCF5245987.1 structural protein [Pseudomonas sp. PA-5-4B]MCF5252685.1 structural protein [Pseudomonas sp. PA-5-4B]MCF5257968.1 structural protein [Pseudomonas sp. PA-5-4A]